MSLNGLLAILTLSLFAVFCNVHGSDANRDKLIKEVFNSVDQQMHEQYHSACFSRGGAMMTDIKSLKMSLWVQDSVTIDEARDIMVTFTELFLEAVNENPDLRPYLANFPFQPDNLGLMVAFLNEDCSETVEPEVDSVILANGTIYYAANALESIFVSNDLQTETYDEALLIFKTGRKE